MLSTCCCLSLKMHGSSWLWMWDRHKHTDSTFTRCSFLVCNCSQSDKLRNQPVLSVTLLECFGPLHVFCLDVTTQVWRVRICYEKMATQYRLSSQCRVPGTLILLAQTQLKHIQTPQSFERQSSPRPSSYSHHTWFARRMEFSKSLVNRLNKVDASTDFSRSLLSGISWC